MLQLIYAAPFILISVLSFGLCLAIPPLRRFALPAIIAPVTFGFFSLAAWIGAALVLGLLLKIHEGPAVGMRGFVEGITFYIFPGLAASCVAVTAIRWLERRFLRSCFAREFVIHLIISLIVGGLAGIAGFAWSASWVSDRTPLLGLTVALAFAGFSVLIASILTFLTLRLAIKRKLASPHEQSTEKPAPKTYPRKHRTISSRS
jgi:hypothetical protein